MWMRSKVNWIKIVGIQRETQLLFGGYTYHVEDVGSKLLWFLYTIAMNYCYKPNLFTLSWAPSVLINS